MENIEKQKIRSELCERIVLEVLKDYNYGKLNEDQMAFLKACIYAGAYRGHLEGGRS